MRENPYPGINAHLNSSLQTPGEIGQPSLWPAFHSQHITNIAETLNVQLPERYVAKSEQALQSREDDLLEGRVILSRPQPDVTIFQSGAAPTGGAVALVEHAPTWEGELVEVLELVKHPNAVVIYELLPQHKLGQIVARIELLSPSNKPDGKHYAAYAVRRAEAIQSDIPLIEIDYLHESAPILDVLPRYPAAGGYPFNITVNDPRPVWDKGRVRVYGFGLRAGITPIPIPLLDDEKLVFDLTPVYHHTFHAGRWGSLLDYSALPERFEAYSADDQGFVREVVARVVQS